MVLDLGWGTETRENSLKSMRAWT
jgi:hypothetical protein